MRPKYVVPLRDGCLVLGERTLIMGVLNVTPDSFSDGGRFVDPRAAVDQALKMEEEGADVIDIGGESTRPGSAPVPAADELRRIVPVLERLHGVARVPLSVDTYKPEVAAEALARGAALINYVALGDESHVAAMVRTVQQAGAALVMMHVRGSPESMHRLPPMSDVVGEVLQGLQGLMEQASRAGLSRERILLDPGFGFGKNRPENYSMLAHFREFQALERPLVAGTSRKSFVGGGHETSSHERIFGTAATITAAILAGAHLVRVHDIAPMVSVAQVADDVLRHDKIS